LPRVLDELLRHGPTRLYLRRTVNVSAALEAILVHGRRDLLLALAEQDPPEGASEDAATTLAMQCFLNEYVWPVSAEEERVIAGVEARILEACGSSTRDHRLPYAKLVLYAMYRAPWRLPCAAALGVPPPESCPAALAEMLRLCVQEPLWEQEITASGDRGSPRCSPSTRRTPIPAGGG
jgi:hypothetical protein